MRAYLFSLCKNLYLDREPYIAQIKPNMIRNIYDGQRMEEWLYDEDEYNYAKFQDEEKELQYILQKFKKELINYLTSRVDHFLGTGEAQRAYSLLNLEIIRILYMVLQFGLFQKQQEDVFSSNQKKKLSDEQRFNESQLEKLIVCLA